MIRQIPEEEKGDFYKKSGIICGVIAAVWFISCIVLHPNVDDFFNYMLDQYRTPGLLKVIGSLCTILLVFAISFRVMPLIEKWKFGYNKLCFLFEADFEKCMPYISEYIMSLAALQHLAALG